MRGRVAEAVQQTRLAEELDPLCTLVRGRMGSSYYAARRFEEAAHAWNRAVALDPALVGPHERLFHAYRHAARPREAVLEAGRVLTLLGASGSATRLLAEPGTDRAVGDFLRGTIAYLSRDAARSPALVADRIAVLHAALGEKDEAMRWLRLAAREHATGLPVTLATDPDLDPAHGPSLPKPAGRALPFLENGGLLDKPHQEPLAKAGRIRGGLVKLQPLQP